MSWPTSQDYNEAIQNVASCCADPDLKSGEAVANAIGLPIPRSGNFADVYQFKGADGRMWAVKCFTRPVAGLGERYARIDEHLAQARLPFTVRFNYLERGIRIRKDWYPLLKMEWVEGFTLNEFVRHNVAKPKYLHALMQMWARLAVRLREAGIAHADLQHGNVLLVPGSAPNKLQLKLIDYDGMWVPALADMPSGEVGHPNFQHPQRLKERLFNADVDRFPHLVIASALRATLIAGKPLWDKFDNGDNLLFKEADLRNPGSPVFKTLWNLHDNALCTLLGRLAIASREPLGRTPWLDAILLDKAGVRLSDAVEQKAIALMGVEPHFAGQEPEEVPDQPLEGEFNDFDFDESDSVAVSSRERLAYKPSSERDKSRSMLPYLIGGGVLTLAMAVFAVVLLTRPPKPPATSSEPEFVRDDDTRRKTEKKEPPKKEPAKKEPDTKEPDTKEPVKKEVPIAPAPMFEVLTQEPRVLGPLPEIKKDATPELIAALPREVIDTPIVLKKKDDPMADGFVRASEAIPERITGTTLSSDGKKIFAIGNAGSLYEFDAATLKETDKAEIGSKTLFTMAMVRKGTSLAPNYDRLYILDESRRLMTFEPDRLKPKPVVFNEMTTRIDVPTSTSHHRLVFSPDLNYLFVTDKDGFRHAIYPMKVGIDAVPDYLPLGTLLVVRNIGFSPDGVYGFAAGNLKASVWERKTANFVQPISTFDLPAYMDWLAFCPELKALIGTDRGRIYALQIAKGKNLWAPLEGHGPGNTWLAALVPKSPLLVTAGGDSTLRLWDLKAGKELNQWKLARKPSSLTVAPDGRTVYVGLMDPNEITQWRLPVPGKKP